MHKEHKQIKKMDDIDVYALLTYSTGLWYFVISKCIFILVIQYFPLCLRGVCTERWNYGVHISASLTITGVELLGHKIFNHFLTLKWGDIFKWKNRSNFPSPSQLCQKKHNLKCHIAYLLRQKMSWFHLPCFFRPLVC